MRPDVLAAALAALCLWLTAGSSNSVTTRVPLRSDLGVAASTGRLRWWAVVACSLLVAVAFGPRVSVYAAVAALVGVATHRLMVGTRRRTDRRRRQVAVIELCDALAAELHAGLPTGWALRLACDGEPMWASLLRTSRLDGDVAGALRAASAKPGGRGLRAVAAAWDVSARSGAGLAGVLDRVAASLRDEQEAIAEVTASVAPSRATGKMLAALPVFGLGLGASMGARPLGVLLGSPLGLGCLGLGLTLAVAGVVWVEHLADAAEA